MDPLTENRVVIGGRRIDFGSRLRHYRGATSVSEFAKLIGISESALAGLEGGSCQPSYPLLLAIRAALELNSNEIYYLIFGVAAADHMWPSKARRSSGGEDRPTAHPAPPESTIVSDPVPTQPEEEKSSPAATGGLHRPIYAVRRGAGVPGDPFQYLNNTGYWGDLWFARVFLLHGGAQRVAEGKGAEVVAVAPPADLGPVYDQAARGEGL